MGTVLRSWVDFCIVVLKLKARNFSLRCPSLARHISVAETCITAKVNAALQREENSAKLQVAEQRTRNKIKKFLVARDRMQTLHS